MLEQERLIERVRQKCIDDPRLQAALMYGSFTQGLADEWSDIEFWLFFDEQAAVTVDPTEWCAEVAPILLVVRNEFDTHVAVFESLIRGEFHFAPQSAIDSVAEWPARGGPVDRMLVADRTGELRRVLEQLPETRPSDRSPASVEQLCERFVNWWLLGDTVRRRGELVRAQAMLGEVNRHLLWMVRTIEGLAPRQTPSRRAEAELSREALERYSATTAPVDAAPLVSAYKEAWRWGRQMWIDLATTHDFETPARLVDIVDDRMRDDT
ncbi:MAG: hypothetical protein ACRDF0_02305 [Candidatus Limnocylindria bacterium]